MIVSVVIVTVVIVTVVIVRVSLLEGHSTARQPDNFGSPFESRSEKTSKHAAH